MSSSDLDLDDLLRAVPDRADPTPGELPDDVSVAAEAELRAIALDPLARRALATAPSDASHAAAERTLARSLGMERSRRASRWLLFAAAAAGLLALVQVFRPRPSPVTVAFILEDQTRAISAVRSTAPRIGAATESELGAEQDGGARIRELRRRLAEGRGTGLGEEHPRVRSLRRSVRGERSVDVARSGTVHVAHSGFVDVLLRPEAAVSGEPPEIVVVAEGPNGVERRVPAESVERFPTGGARVRARVADLYGPEPGDWTLHFLVAPAHPLADTVSVAGREAGQHLRVHHRVVADVDGVPVK